MEVFIKLIINNYLTQKQLSAEVLYNLLNKLKSNHFTEVKLPFTEVFIEFIVKKKIRSIILITKVAE